MPEELLGVPFLGREAVDSGLLTRDQLRNRVWIRLLRGIYVSRGSEHDPAVRIAALRLAVGDVDRVVVAGRTAAWVHGVWRPREGRPLPLEITRPSRAPGTSAAGVTRRRLALLGSPDLVRPPCGLSDLDHDIVERDGLHLTSPVRTCFDLMRERRLVEAVVVADAFAAESGPTPEPVGIPLLAAYCADRRGWRDVRTARAAAELASSASRSPQETRLRMVVVLAGFPEPLVNVPVTDPSTGAVLAMPDLMVPDPVLTGLEYDGTHHDEGDQPTRDRTRANRLLTAAGLPLLRYDAAALRTGRERIVRDVAAVSRYRHVLPLDDADFRTPPPRLAW